MVSGLGTGAAWCRPVLRPAVAVLAESDGFMGSRGIRGSLMSGLKERRLGKELNPRGVCRPSCCASAWLSVCSSTGQVADTPARLASSCEQRLEFQAVWMYSSKCLKVFIAHASGPTYRRASLPVTGQQPLLVQGGTGEWPGTQSQSIHAGRRPGGAVSPVLVFQAMKTVPGGAVARQLDQPLTCC